MNLSLAGTLLVWLLACSAVLAFCWRRRVVGLVLAYLMHFWLLHWVCSFMYLFDWPGQFDRAWVQEGFEVSLLGVVAFSAGVWAARPVFRELALPRYWAARPPATGSPRHGQRYLQLGIVCYFFILPALGKVPTLSSILSSGLNLAVAGLVLGLWRALAKRDTPRLVWGFAFAGLLPLLTVFAAGFLGYGTIAALACFAFVATNYKPRWRVVAVAGVLAYVALSVYVTYMRDRRDLRARLERGAGVEERAERLGDTLATFEPFDPTNARHLQRVDMRLNQNYLVGAAVLRLRAGQVRFAAGATLWQSVLALIPRVLWPDKPIGAGSGDYVSTFTGIPFGEGTSVGMGQVFEFYVNFGGLGVIAGLFAFGGVLSVVDELAATKLQAGDAAGCALWYVPALSLLQVGGSLVDITASCAGGLILVYACNAALSLGERRRRP